MCDPRLLQWSTDHLPPHPHRRVSEFALCILIMWFVYGGTLVAAGFTGEWSPTPALRAVPSWLELALGVSIQLGTALVVIGVVPQHKMASQRWAFEISGFILTAVGWLSFALTALFLAPTSTAHWTYGFGFALASLVRVIRVRGVSDHTRGVKRLLDSQEEG